MSRKEFNSLRELVDEFFAVSRLAEESYGRLVRVLASHSLSSCGKGCVDLFPHPKVVMSAKTALDSFAQEVTANTVVRVSISENAGTALFVKAYCLIGQVHNLFEKLQAAYKRYSALKRPYKCKAMLFVVANVWRKEIKKCRAFMVLLKNLKCSQMIKHLGVSVQLKGCLMYFTSKVIVVVTLKPCEDGRFSFAPRSAGTCFNYHC